MSKFTTTGEAAVKRDITERKARELCDENRIYGAKKKCGACFTPALAEKPFCEPTNPACKKNINMLSLFSGCGGMDLGFEGDFNVLRASVNEKINKNWKISVIDDNWIKLPKNRFHTVFANDIKKEARLAWTNYFSKKGISGSTYYPDSIVDLVKLHKENGASVFPKNIDIVVGGFPCQDFSIAGKRKGFNSDKSHSGKKITDDNTPSAESRGQLYMWMREVIDITQPKMFVAENVKGLVSMGDVKSVIERDFSTVGDGYIVLSAGILHSADFGVPQSRERIIFYGFKKSALTNEALKALSCEDVPVEFDPYPFVTHAYTKPGEDLLPPVTLKQAFVGLNEPDKSTDISQQRYSKAKFMGKHCQGQTEINLDGIGPTIRSEHHGNIEFRRLSPEHGGKYRSEFEKGCIERRLSVRECARIQTFPDSYEFVFKNADAGESLSASEAYKLIGNAVPPLLSFHIAKRLEDLWELYFGGEELDNIRK